MDEEISGQSVRAHQVKTSVDLLFDTLSHPYRRRLLSALVDRDPGTDATIDPMAVIADGDDSDDVRIALYHSHLPHLEKAGFIEWERGSSIVRPGPRYEDVESLVELLIDNEDVLPADWL